jgi:hypothetical protein
MSLSSLSQLARLNTVAASFYRDGNEHAALSILMDTLRNLKTFCDARDQMDVEMIDAYENEKEFHPFSGIYSVNPKEKEDEQVYNGLFLITDDVPSTSWSVGAVLVFNAGLLHHREGIRLSKSESMARAVKFYKKSIRLLEEFAESETLTVMLAAIYHNMKHIHDAFFQTKQAQRMVNCLAELFNWMEEDTSVSKEAIGFFRASLFYSTLTKGTGAPAA